VIKALKNLRKKYVADNLFFYDCCGKKCTGFQFLHKACCGYCGIENFYYDKDLVVGDERGLLGELEPLVRGELPGEVMKSESKKEEALPKHKK